MIEIRLGTEKEQERLKQLFPRTIQVIGDGGFLVLAVNDNNIVGFLWAFKRKIPAPVEYEELFINVIEVVPEELRCQGLATKMLNKIKEVALRENVYQLRAYCDIHNVSSHRLWAKNGYSVNPVTMPDGTTVGSFVGLVL